MNESPHHTQCAPLNDILRLHPKILELEKEHGGIPPYLPIPADHLTKESVLAILQLRPIICCASKSGLKCIGNARSYQIAKDCLDPKTEVPYQLMSPRKHMDIERLFWAERLLLPMTTGLSKPGNKWIYDLWQSYHSVWNKVWRQPPLKKVASRKSFADLLGVDDRTIK